MASNGATYFLSILVGFLAGGVVVHLVHQSDVLIIAQDTPSHGDMDSSRLERDAGSKGPEINVDMGGHKLVHNTLKSPDELKKNEVFLDGSAGRNSPKVLPKEADEIGIHIMNDTQRHGEDDHTVADNIRKKVRILCWVMTHPDNLATKATAVRNTWGKRCDVLLFASDYENKTFPTIDIHPGKGREHLTAKAMQALDYVYKHHLGDADWFLRTDDDSYIVMENLRYMLSKYSPKEPITFGKHFKVIVPGGYYSGGGGIVMSKEAIIRVGGRNPGQCKEDTGADDVEFGFCFKKFGISIIDSNDNLNRTRFHCFRPEDHIHGNYPDWYLQYDKLGGLKGLNTLSDYAISFHYVTAKMMYDMEFYTYHLRPYGILSALQDLNKPV